MTRLSALLPCLALAVACVAEDQTTILILHNKVPDESCAIPVAEGAVYAPTGVLDLESRLSLPSLPPASHVLVRVCAQDDANVR